MTGQCDVAIIGGGVIGSAIACCLAGEPGFQGGITVLDAIPPMGRRPRRYR